MASSSHTSGPHCPDNAAARRCPAPKRKNLKNHEWVLVHQHQLRRITENKGTAVVIHGVKQDPRKPDSMPLPQLPSHIELRSPSPDLGTFSQANVDYTALNLGLSPNRLEEVPASMSPRGSHTTSDRQSGDELTSEGEEDETFEDEDEFYERERATEAVSRDLPLSDVLNSFRRSDWSQSPKTSFSLHLDSFEPVTAQRGDSLGTFVDRLYNSGCPVSRGKYFETIRMLVHENHVSPSHFLETLFQRLNGRKFEIPRELSRAINIGNFGARALGTAACQNNFRAVDVLLFEGVDINGKVSDPHNTEKCRCQISIMAYAQLPRFNEEDPGASDEMIAYLLARGAAKSEGVDTSLMGLLQCALRQHFKDKAILSSALRIVDRMHRFADFTFEAESILETCILEWTCYDYYNSTTRAELFRSLLGKGAKMSHGSPLASLIFTNGIVYKRHRRFIENLIESTENINAYCNSVLLRRCSSRCEPYNTIQCISPLQAAACRQDEGMIQLLLQKGADIDCAARGPCGLTPLQGICSFETMPHQDLKQKMMIVELLLENGANVNAAPAWTLGLTALQAAAYVGDVEVAERLVCKGADVNAPACKYGGGTALELGARKKHFSMVLYLLKAGAAIPTSGVKVSSLGVTYEDYRLVSDCLPVFSSTLEAEYGRNGTPSRSYREYEAIWADDPTYNKG